MAARGESPGDQREGGGLGDQTSEAGHPLPSLVDWTCYLCPLHPLHSPGEAPEGLGFNEVVPSMAVNLLGDKEICSLVKITCCCLFWVVGVGGPGMHLHYTDLQLRPAQLSHGPRGFLCHCPSRTKHKVAHPDAWPCPGLPEDLPVTPTSPPLPTLFPPEPISVFTSIREAARTYPQDPANHTEWQEAPG